MRRTVSTRIHSTNTGKKAEISGNVSASYQWIVGNPAHVELQRNHVLSRTVNHKYLDWVPKVDFMGKIPLPIYNVYILHIEMGPISMVLESHTQKRFVAHQKLSVSCFLQIWFQEK